MWINCVSLFAYLLFLLQIVKRGASLLNICYLKFSNSFLTHVIRHIYTKYGHIYTQICPLGLPKLLSFVNVSANVSRVFLRTCTCFIRLNLFDFPNFLITHNSPDMILAEKAIRRRTIVDVAVSDDFNVVRTEDWKVEKYQDLAFEVKITHHVNSTSSWLEL